LGKSFSEPIVVYENTYTYTKIPIRVNFCRCCLVEVELFLVEVELFLVEVELFLVEVELLGRG
jgi:hypothetical protein